MKINNVYSVFFSPSGSTKKVADCISVKFNKEVESIDLLKEPLNKKVQLCDSDLLIVSMPVFSGRIPKVCPDMLKKLCGNNSMAITIAVYGNRDYDDALLEMNDILKENGFKILSSAAIIGQHSIFTNVATDRPDKDDIEIMNKFVDECKDKISDYKSVNEIIDINVKGNRPYKPTKSLKFKPIVNDNCTSCGLCAQVCPVNAIDKNNPKVTNEKLCFTCTACISICPFNARTLELNEGFADAKEGFYNRCGKRLESEFYI